LYVRLARRHGADSVAFGFIPVLLACFASSALAVSNLTNLLASEHFDVDTADFIVRLGPPSVAATVVGFIAFSKTFRTDAEGSRDDIVVPARALHIGVPVVAFVVFGFTIGDVVGVPAWLVAATADVALIAVVRRVPWRSAPVGAAALAATLGVLAAVAAPHLRLDELFDDSGTVRVLVVLGLAVVAANTINNLPAFLVTMPALSSRPGNLLWAVLLGVNMGPVLVVTGSLAGLLWLSTMDRLGVPVTARTYTRVGLRVGLPAIVAATLTLVIGNVLASA
jgi:arsenical pump membrane protein